MCPVTGRYTFLDHDLYEVEITAPFTGLRDGDFHDYPMVRKTLYVKDGRITRLCRKDAAATLQKIYRGCIIFEREQEAFRQIVLGALEEGKAFDQLHLDLFRPSEGDEDTRTLREQRDEFILTRIVLQITSQGVYLSLRNMAVLIERHFGIKLWCSDQIETEIVEREEPE